MTTVAEHVHEVAEYHRVLDMSWCACGQELKHGRWREPRTSAGKLKRFAWERPVQRSRTTSRGDRAMVDEVTIYKFWSTTDDLLYVGITSRGPQRWQEHMATKSWWGEVARSTMEHVASRREALDRERALIRQFRPRYNIVHNTDPLPQYVKLLDYRCAICGDVGGAEEMFIELSREEVDRHEREMKQWIQDHPPQATSWGTIPASDLVSYPEPAHWQTMHIECDPHPESHGTYYIAGSAAATHEDLLYWTAHLMEKRWFMSTDWDVLIASTVYQDRRGS